MQKLYRTLATFGLVALLVPTMAFANNGNQKENSHKIKAESTLHGKFKINHTRVQTGIVTSIGTNSFVIQPQNSTSQITVNTTGATITQAFGSQIQINDLKVNDKATVKGTLTGNTINATNITITPVNTHKAEAKGTVTAITGNVITLQTIHHGVVNSVTINTTASTTVQTQNNSTTSTSSILVGSKIQVKGLWNELLNVLNAFKIKIK